MASHEPGQEGQQRFLYRTVRHVPNLVAGEFYNVALVIYDLDGRELDARFAPDLRRTRCNPAVNHSLLAQMQEEFDDRRLVGENFSSYLEELVAKDSNQLIFSEPTGVLCKDLAVDIDRLVNQLLATSPGEDGGDAAANSAGGREAVRLRMTEVFALHGLFRNGHGVRRDISVDYDEHGRKFVFDFQYRRASNEECFAHALGLRRAVDAATKLCFVFERRRRRLSNAMSLTVVAEDGVANDARRLLADDGIQTIDLSAIDGYAETIRNELGP